MILNKFKIKNYLLKNRIVVSPMCQYKSNNGSPSLWHYQHLLKLLTSGAGMLVLESTAISNDAKISKGDLCLSNIKQKKDFKKLVNYLKLHEKNTPIVLQISHAGRKGSSEIPFIKANSPILKIKDRWKTYSASNIKKDNGWPKPFILSRSKMNIIKNNFVSTTKFTNQVGFDGLELHMAHGYLLHQFLSPISNIRKDDYGGNLVNRCKYPLEIAYQIRKYWPTHKLLGARITAIDHLKGGINLKESIYLSKKLEKIGFDYICVSSGGILTKTNLKFYKGFRVKFASIIKKNINIPVRVSGMMNDLNFSNRAIAKKKIDFIAIGRSFVSDPNLIYKYAKLKSLDKIIPKQYQRCF